jgi:hypothetical protein
MSGFDPEKEFVASPPLSRTSALLGMKPTEGVAGVVFSDLAEMEQAFEVFCRGSVAVFESSGVFGTEGPDWYRASREAARVRLLRDGYFKKPLNQEGLHANVFDTQVEMLRVGEDWILKLFYKKDDGIEVELATKSSRYVALTAVALELEFGPVEEWWFALPLAKLVGALGYGEENVLQVLETLSDPGRMQRRLVLPLQHGGRDFQLSLLLLANRRVRRLAPQFVRVVEGNLVGPAWDVVKERTISDVPKLLISLAYPPAADDGTPLGRYCVSHLCNSLDLEELRQAQEWAAQQISQELGIEQKPVPGIGTFSSGAEPS